MGLKRMGLVALVTGGITAGTYISGCARHTSQPLPLNEIRAENLRKFKEQGIKSAKEDIASLLTYQQRQIRQFPLELGDSKEKMLRVYGKPDTAIDLSGDGWYGYDKDDYITRVYIQDNKIYMITISTLYAENRVPGTSHSLKDFVESLPKIRIGKGDVAIGDFIGENPKIQKDYDWMGMEGGYIISNPGWHTFAESFGGLEDGVLVEMKALEPSDRPR